MCSFLTRSKPLDKPNYLNSLRLGIPGLKWSGCCSLHPSGYLSMTKLRLETDSIFLDPQIFLSLLDKEMARAERYNQHVSILLLKLEGVQKREQDFWLERLAQVLADKVRKSDCFGGFEKGTLGVILICASAERARMALERLRVEALLCLSRGPQGLTLKTSYAEYPSEATSLDSLCDLATERLLKEHQA